MMLRMVLVTIALIGLLFAGAMIFADIPRRVCAKDADGKITCCCRTFSGMCCAEQDYGWCGPIVRGCICTG
jgi:hypothetical protein